MRRYRSGSEYAHAGHFRPMAGAERRLWLLRLDEAHREGAISPVTWFVGRELHRRHGPGGRCDPSAETIARAIGHCVRAVRLALKALKVAKLIDWTPRIVPTPEGVRQTSNAYRLFVASLEALKALAKSKREPGCKDCTGTEARFTSKAYVPNTAPIPGPQAPVRSVEEQLRLLATPPAPKAPPAPPITRPTMLDTVVAAARARMAARVAVQFGPPKPRGVWE